MRVGPWVLHKWASGQNTACSVVIILCVKSFETVTHASRLPDSLLLLPVRGVTLVTVLATYMFTVYYTPLSKDPKRASPCPENGYIYKPFWQRVRLRHGSVCAPLPEGAFVT